MPRTLITILAATLLLTLLTACESKVTLANYDQVTEGMSLVEVERILGPGTEEVSSGGHSIGGSGMLSGASAPTARTFVWEDGPRKIILTFSNGTLATKTQSGL